MTPDPTSEMLATLRTGLGLEVVPDQANLLPSYERNVGGFERRIGGVVRPRNTDEVVAVVRAANRHQVALHPISGGRNWGLGSRLPVADGAVVVDLGRMNRIGAVDAAHGYMEIEPGVTQAQVHELLQRERLSYLFNVVGSSVESSIIGNALERGVGYFGSRVESVSLTEVVTGAGDVLRLGYSRYPDAQTAMLYRYGLGPDVQGLFFQSNMGIVTRAVLELIPQPAHPAVLVCGIKDPAHLPRLFDGLRELVRDGVIRSAMHIANRARTESSAMPKIHQCVARMGMGSPEVVSRVANELFQAYFRGAWTAVAGALGTSSENRQLLSRVRRRLGSFTTVRLIDGRLLGYAKRLVQPFRALGWVRKQLAMLDAMTPFLEMAQGIPNSAALASVTWPVTGQGDEHTDPDSSSAGLLYCLPVVPLSGDAVRQANTIIDTVFGRSGFTPYITYNVVTRGALEGVINLAFDRTNAEVTRKAHACVMECQVALAKAGFYPYRLSIDAMGEFIHADDPFWSTVSALKKVLDPNGILAPGRYCPREG